jgi:hypothetical protein
MNEHADDAGVDDGGVGDGGVGDGGVLGDLLKRKREQTPPDSGICLDRSIMTPGQTTLARRCVELGMSPPKRRDQTIAEMDDVLERIKADCFQFENDNNDHDNEKILMFLYGRDFFRRNTVKRMHNVTAMLDPQQGAHNRIKQLLHLNADLYNEKDCAYFEDFRKRSKFWCNIAMNYGFKKNHEGGTGHASGCNIFSLKGSIFLQRVQLSSHCFLHASVVVQSYSLRGSVVQAVDICKYARNVLSCEELAKYIVDNDGGSSEQVLRDVLKEKGITVVEGSNMFDHAVDMFDHAVDRNDVNDDTSPTIKPANLTPSTDPASPIIHGANMSNHTIDGRMLKLSSGVDGAVSSIVEGGHNPRESCTLEQHLKAYGAGLVSHFRIEPRFHSFKQVSSEEFQLPIFDGDVAVSSDPDVSDSYHAMVLVGMLKKSDGKWWLLLQNWWPQMQLVEVSQQYFLSSGASICFVSNNQTGIPRNFARCDKRYAEAHIEGSDGPATGFDAINMTYGEEPQA